MIEMFPALEGDCFLISLGEEEKTHILIDGGFGETYESFLKNRLQELTVRGEHLALVVVTHIDADHIGGLLELFEENNSSLNPDIIHIDEVWHNSYKHLQFYKENEGALGWKEKSILSDIIAKGSIKTKRFANESRDISAEQGSTLAGLLYSGGYNWNKQFDGKAINCEVKNLVSLNSDVSIRILSPNYEKLKRLEKYWLKELRKEKYDFKITNDKLFDDAFEFYMMKQEEIEEYEASKNISHKKKNSDLEIYLDKKMSYDNSPVNGSSISFVIEYQGKKLLFLGDSHPRIIELEIQKLIVEIGYNPIFDLIKVSHHGSHRNTSKKLLEIIDSDIFLFSTNGERNNHPNLETVARIVCRETDKKRLLLFNYPQKNVVLNSTAIQERHKFKINYSNGDSPILFEV